MPKKRQTVNQLHKQAHHLPATTATGSSSSDNKSVNELLAGLRRLAIDPSEAGRSAMLSSHQRTLPPEVRQILQIPEAPPTLPRRPVTVGANGRRLPPGPPPPRSWLLGNAVTWPGQSVTGSVRGSVSGATGSAAAQSAAFQEPLQGIHSAQYGSLTDIALRTIVYDWECQAVYNRFYLYTLSSRLRVSLIRYISLWGPHGVTAKDLRLILAGPPREEFGMYGIEDDIPPAPNDDIFHLDISGSPGRSIKIKELADILFPSRHTQPLSTTDDTPDSWDAELPQSMPSLPALLPNLTHLSLGIMPLGTNSLLPTPAHAPSWQELLTHASKLSAITHLSLAHWPVPSRTQKASLSSVVAVNAGGSSRSVQYGGTGPYSHSLDEDYSEAVSVLRHLSRSLYRLKHLDLTGCGEWCPKALTLADAAGNMVDWAGDWGQLTVLRVGSGEVGREQRSVLLAPPNVQDTLFSKGDAWRVSSARQIERHVIARRKGVGRPITVQTDWEDEDITAGLGMLSM